MRKNQVHPVNNIRWVPVEKVKPNKYNPNEHVDSSMVLLRRSIIRDGFTQPIVVTPADKTGTHTVIDGEHRFKCAKILGFPKVPVAVLDRDRAGCIAATIRHNRARGHHAVKATVEVVKMMREDGLSGVKIRTALGISQRELQRLELDKQAFAAILSGRDLLS